MAFVCDAIGKGKRRLPGPDADHRVLVRGLVLTGERAGEDNGVDMAGTLDVGVFIVIHIDVVVRMELTMVIRRHLEDR